ncbi:FtsB family cell division protein [Mycolicibacterium sp.]|uniref:FtsB family cell division protein n=1 Tax=Mycolicibacterium sp. TaxID=2320850 RepID=UPI003D14D0C8
MPEAKRPDPKRRAPAPRPGKPGKPRGTSARRTVQPKPGKVVGEPVTEPEDAAAAGRSVRDSIAVSAARASEQRFGSAARRAAILAAVVCVLTLTIAGPVRTYFAQRTEMKQLAASERQLREQIAELEQQKQKLADPVFIAAQARERLGFVMPGEIPYQVQLPPGTPTPGAAPEEPGAKAASTGPWYTALWHTIADAPHGISPPAPPGAPGAPEPVAPQPGG